MIFDLSRKNELPTRLILGSDALTLIQASEKQREEAMAAWQPVTQSTDADDADLSWLGNM